MFWKKKKKFDRVQATLDKFTIDEDKRAMLENMPVDPGELINLYADGDTLAAQLILDEELFAFYLFPESPEQSEKFGDLCLEMGIRVEREKDVESDLPEEYRMMPMEYAALPMNHWCALTCLFVKELFGVEEFEAKVERAN